MSSINELMGEDRPRPAPVAMDIERVRLTDALAVWQRVYAPAVGDLVRQRVGISQPSVRSGPPTGAYVVLEVRPEALINWDPGVPAAFGSKFDVLLGYYDEDGDFCFSWTDSRRYEPLPDEPA